MFDRQQLKKFRTDFDKVLKEFSKESGITLEIGNISYSGDTFSTKLKGFSTANGEDPGQLEFNKVAMLFNLTKEDYGKQFTTYNGTYKLTGLKVKSHKYPVIGEEVGTGRSFKFPRAVLEKLKQV